MYIFDFLGLSSFNWKNRHVKGHHKYSNIMYYDPDIQQSKIVKIFVQDSSRSFHHINGYICHLYMLFLFQDGYFYRDFKDILFKKIGGFYNSSVFFQLKKSLKWSFLKYHLLPT